MEETKEKKLRFVYYTEKELLWEIDIKAGLLESVAVNVRNNIKHSKILALYLTFYFFRSIRERDRTLTKSRRNINA